MTPYETFYFFFIVGLLLIPSIILGLQGKPSRKYNMFVTIIMLAIIFGNSLIGSLSLIVFTIWQITLINSYMKYRKQANSTLIFCLCVLLSILPLILVKVLPFLELGNFFGFLGISYLTFKAVQMIMETRDGLVKENIPLGDLLYFLLFFPTISSGPIDRWRRFEKNNLTPPTKEEYRWYLHEGIDKIFKGFLYKFIIAYLIHHYIMMEWMSSSYFNTRPILYYFVDMYSYSMYLFFDFAGYSAFAIGISYIMGIKTPENFNLPFISRNIKDFWNRWHMTLSFWFRDYIYMRFALWMTKKKWIKNRYTISNIGYILLFFIMGVWHGPVPHYIVYGLYHAFLIVSFDYIDRWNKKRKIYPKNTFTHVIGVILTFNFVCFGFYIFSGHLFY
ncbi:D-alanyl-lipoteichoic acid biosynthesis protein DltB [Lederbergia sp. NSJ-179]|uniref:D-alanyl-lipoteichoic acid biosynthesis protein DltB n=1 Tax=Lederbergia sp. NSJ-179 TaxID=2931402 RepID=UPI001FD60C7B|nr:D-alanyl-lipoteichoic acid biosynthesis protein DltB [Lederbergia sp. NSJ-179]MCJ7841566.1 D-alanyl-lipoteichoic acid biosynthesis protein DltB [Lederbergia sp. NSJ-179]